MEEGNTIKITEGLRKVINERMEHLTKHNRHPMDDVLNNPDRQLIRAAKTLMHSEGSRFLAYKLPNGWDKDAYDKMFNKSLIDRLVIAASLIVAEIDRLELEENMKTVK